MWISRRKADALEKRIADLELQVQSQQEKLETSFLARMFIGAFGI